MRSCFSILTLISVWSIAGTRGSSPIMQPDSNQLDDSVRRLTDQWIASGLLASKDHQHSMGSTNSVAGQWVQSHREKNAESGANPTEQLPRLIIADVQTAGRGRLGRTWKAQSDGLAFSLVIQGCHELLSIAVGVAIAESIEHIVAPVRCGLKWPNDTWMSGVKVAGTLIERFDTTAGIANSNKAIAVIGIGVNVGTSPTLDDSPATSIQESTGRWVTRAEVLSELIPTLIQKIEMCESDSQELLDSFRRRCVLTGELIRCSIDGRAVEGRCEGINDEGELRVRTESGELICRSGEVSRVRMV
ncbi:biotin--[acetyl-CoA-carboxylase] ligase [Aporhodopirellula aestuarii]|uniref:biotin--[biotin carboxyl-carrier protein] ligase n=1 Tax=Aporhodopirellula aestuarii TaxID=2950107 RepID=A0ABT0U623_9BACT|nr:biotin--[acetyl-CoA-carboxylase] ligase [Aporhodopirellula aestuarii]MCM2371843.1 biotin--[acetyl-CoA-carboxylase] ligase [Aporhodopirellula aestuarii]